MKTIFCCNENNAALLHWFFVVLQLYYSIWIFCCINYKNYVFFGKKTTFSYLNSFGAGGEVVGGGGGGGTYWAQCPQWGGGDLDPRWVRAIFPPTGRIAHLSLLVTPVAGGPTRAHFCTTWAEIFGVCECFLGRAGTWPRYRLLCWDIRTLLNPEVSSNLVTAWVSGRGQQLFHVRASI